MVLKNLRILFLIIILLILILVGCIFYNFQRIYSNHEIIIIKNTVKLQHNLTNLLLKCDAKLLKLTYSCNHTYSFSHSKDCSQCEQKTINYHTIWEIESDKSNFQFRILNLNVISYLATQNLCCTRLILWIMRNKFPRNKLEFIIEKFKYYFNKNIQVKQFNLSELCKKDSSFKYHKLCLNLKLVSLDKYSSVELSDFARVFVLDIYGGIYVDGDVIFLKDMQPLWSVNFAYRWSFLDRLNNAIIGINRKDSFSKVIKTIQDYSTTYDDLIANFNPIKLTYILTVLNKGSIYNYNSFRILHSYLFDPAWLCNDGILARYDSKSVCSFNEFVSRQFINETEFNITTFYPGVFTYHLHLKNLRPKNMNKNSYFIYLETYFSSLVKINSLKTI